MGTFWMPVHRLTQLLNRRIRRSQRGGQRKLTCLWILVYKPLSELTFKFSIPIQMWIHSRTWGLCSNAPKGGEGPPQPGSTIGFHLFSP
jgi:hypothetical protein